MMPPQYPIHHRNKGLLPILILLSYFMVVWDEALSQTPVQKGPDKPLSNELLIVRVSDLSQEAQKRRLTEFEHVVESVKSEPRNEKTLISCVRLALYVGRFEDAVLIATHGIDLCPKSAALHSYRGVANSELGNLESATVDLEKSLQLDARFQNGFTWYRLAVVQSNRDNSKAAFASIGEALKCQRDSDRLAFYSQLLVEDGQIDTAIKCAKEAVELDPKHLYSRLVLGFSFGCVGDTKRSDEEFQNALKIKNDELTQKAVVAARNNAVRYFRAVRLSKPDSYR